MLILSDDGPRVVFRARFETILPCVRGRTLPCNPNRDLALSFFPQRAELPARYMWFIWIACIGSFLHVPRMFGSMLERTTHW